MSTNKNKTNYKIMFILGICLFVPIGIIFEIIYTRPIGLGFLVIGIILSILSIAHKKEW